MKLKICGINDADFAVKAAELGVDYLGFIFHSSSPRNVTVEQAKAIAKTVPRAALGCVASLGFSLGRGASKHPFCPQLVGVFVKQSVSEIVSTMRAARLDIVQLHRRATAEDVAAIRAAGYEVWTLAGGAPGDGVLFDSSHGDGQTDFLTGDYTAILAGRIGIDNLAEALAKAPDILDVNSSLETAPGSKSVARLEAFLSELGRERRIGYVGFSAQRLEMLRNGWLQARYYSDADSTRVKDFLSYEDVYEVNPFELGVRGRGREKKAFRERFQGVVALLDLKDLLPRAFVSLSNGETRRVMLARELLKDPEILEMDDPYNGLDPEQCAKLTAVIATLRARGVAVEVRGDVSVPRAAFGRGTGADCLETPRPGEKPSEATQPKAARGTERPAVVSFNDITVKYGRRTLYRHFSWTVREGEHWVLRGRNGSGKTTLMALITGDSPLAYGLDVSVFGQRRDIGCDLHAMRAKIAMVSPEMQAYLGKDPETLLAEALKKRPKLLILDEPCMNLDLVAAKSLCATVAAYLRAHPRTTAICIAHRPEHVPAGFDRELDLDVRP